MLIVNENGLKVEETLIDDSIQHIVTAHSLGIHSYLLKCNESEIIENLFKR